MAGPRATMANWYRTRLTRRPYAIWSPLPLEWATARLVNNLAPSGYSRSEAKCTGRVSGAHVRLAPVRSPFFATSASLRFEGTIEGTDEGSWLRGSLGPLALVCGFSIAFLAMGCFFLLAGIADVLGTAGGNSGPWPAVWVPAILVAGGIAFPELGYRIAMADWKAGERWLLELLQVPGSEGGITH
jgi:hypothetical protein